MVAENKKFVHTVVSDDLKAWLLKRAKAQGRSLSNYTGWLLEQARLMADATEDGFKLPGELVGDKEKLAEYIELTKPN